MNKELLKEIIVEQRAEWTGRNAGVVRTQLAAVQKHLASPHAVVVAGVRRCGKSTLFRQLLGQTLIDRAYFLTFEDERLLEFKTGDFNLLLQCLMELYGDRRMFLLDEIQNAPRWEMFVRRLQENGYKFFLTGSNASLLSREFGTTLTGRSITVELFPFSFREYLTFRQDELTEEMLRETAHRARLQRHLDQYLRLGGMPEFLKYGEPDILRRLYDDILYRDIVARHDIKDVRALRELGLYYLSHPGSRFSFNKLKAALQLGSVNTVSSYTTYLQDSYLIFTLSRFDYSLKKQMVAAKKVYCVDTGLLDSIAFQFSKNRGKLLENLVFMELRRRTQDLYYYETKSGKEVDFLIRQGRSASEVIQVTQSLSDPGVQDREISALQEAMQELKLSEGLVLTENDPPSTPAPGISVMPIQRWLLQPSPR